MLTFSKNLCVRTLAVNTDTASEDKETQIAVTGVLQFFLFIGPDNDTDATKKTDITYYWPPSKVIDPTKYCDYWAQEVTNI